MLYRSYPSNYYRRQDDDDLQRRLAESDHNDDPNVIASRNRVYLADRAILNDDLGAIERLRGEGEMSQPDFQSLLSRIAHTQSFDVANALLEWPQMARVPAVVVASLVFTGITMDNMRMARIFEDYQHKRGVDKAEYDAELRKLREQNERMRASAALAAASPIVRRADSPDPLYN